MEKKRFKVLLCLFFCAAAVMLTGCSSGGDDNKVSPEVTPGTVGELPAQLLASAELVKTLDAENKKIILFYYVDGKDASAQAVYNWVKNGDESKLVPFSTDSATGISYADFSADNPMILSEVKDAIAAGEDFNFIIRPKNSWTGQSADLVFPVSEGIKHMMYYNGDLYTVSDDMSAAFSYARMETLTTMKVELGVKYGLQVYPDANGFSVTADDGSVIQIADVVNYNAQDNRSKNNTNVLLITLASSLDTAKTWSIKHNDFGSKEISTQNAVKISLKDFKYERDDLGLTFDGEKAIFKVWAPLAKEVKILFYDDASKVGNFKAETVVAKACGSTTEESLEGEPCDTQAMVVDKDTGIWSYTLDSVGAKKYYKYKISNNGVTYWTSDIYAKVCSPDAIASQIVDINKSALGYGTKSDYKNPFGSNGTVKKDYTDAVIYEMHIRDWSRATVPASTGKFSDFASDDVIAHLTDLEVTHVQILPMFEYAQVVSDDGYNWGYNPYHYNVPESRYVKDMRDGTDAVGQVRDMIKKFHENGIAVIMDVVYNHTSGTQGGSLYDSTVPYYYYRIKEDGTYSNGSGCGNETDTEAPMYLKYMIDSLKHWMLDYHVNGFRFDLMGIHSKEAMAEIYKELSAIDPNVMVYGEPWTGGDCLVKNSATSSVLSADYGVGAFDDDFRDAIKGAEFGGFKTGQVQGEFNDEGIANGLTGKSGKNNRNTTGLPGLALHYVECHDNFTLHDKLVYSLEENLSAVQAADEKGKIATEWSATVTEAQLELIKKEDELAAAFVFLSQGTPFINGGQEFMRTKKGNPDSYSADTKGGVQWTNGPGEHNIDDVNTVDLSFKETYADVYNVYKGLRKLRKENPEAFGKNTSATASRAKCEVSAGKYARTSGVTKYTAGDFRVFFNATAEEVVLEPGETEGYLHSVDVSSGAPTKSTTVPTSVPAKSFVILKK